MGDHRSEGASEGRQLAAVLMILPFNPNPLRYGICTVVGQFRRFAEVDILCLDDGNPLHVPDGVRSIISINNASKVARFFRVLAGVLRGHPIGLEFYHSLRLPQVLDRLNITHYDAIYVKRLPLHRLKINHPNVIYDADDSWSNKCRIMAKLVPGYKGLLYRLDTLFAPGDEAAACNAARVVIVVAEREAENFRKLGVTQPLRPFMHGIVPDLPPRGIHQRSRLVISFHGKLSYKPNEIALSILNDVIVPKLDSKRFDFRVIGQCPPDFPSRYRSLTFSGYVKSIPMAIRDSDLSIFPLTLSFGFPTKVWESLSVGVPAILTPGIVEGLPPMPELVECGVYVRDIDGFVAQIERFSQLSLEERSAISENCRRYAERVSSPTTINTQWNQIMTELTCALIGTENSSSSGRRHGAHCKPTSEAQ
jgi:glycosyltransferase involved in cell wall biosynthesis